MFNGVIIGVGELVIFNDKSENVNGLVGGGVNAEEPRELEGLKTSKSLVHVGLKDCGDSPEILSGGLSAVEPSKSLKPGGGIGTLVLTRRLLGLWIEELLLLDDDDEVVERLNCC